MFVQQVLARLLEESGYQKDSALSTSDFMKVQQLPLFIYNLLLFYIECINMFLDMSLFCIYVFIFHLCNCKLLFLNILLERERELCVHFLIFLLDVSIKFYEIGNKCFWNK